MELRELDPSLPAISLDGPEKDRDAVIPAFSKFLRDNGGRIRVFPFRFEDLECWNTRAWMEDRRQP